jgi:segregation and condensation protein B
MVKPTRRDASQPNAEDQASDLGLEAFQEVSDEQGISLDELGQAYAQLIGEGEDPYDPPESAPPSSAEDVVSQQADDEQADAACELCPRSILESILFVGHPNNEPLPADRIADLMRGVPAREIEELVEELNESYQELGHPYQIVAAGPGFRLELRPEFASLRNAFYGRVREAKLSQAAIDVLAIVAYQQGCTREEIDKVRERQSGPLLSQLVRRQLLRVERPDEKPRKPRYFTTERFLDLFGLAGLEDLPQSQEFD